MPANEYCWYNFSISRSVERMLCILLLQFGCSIRVLNVLPLKSKRCGRFYRREFRCLVA